MFNRKQILMATLTLSLLTCRFDSLMIASPAQAASLTKTELLPFSESLVQVIKADLAKALSGNLLKGTTASFSFASLDSLLRKNENCTNTSLSKRSELVTETFLHFDCPQVQGSKEVQSTKDSDTWVFSSATQLQIFDKDQIYELQDRATHSFSREGDLRIEKEYEDIKKEAFSTSSISGSLNYDLRADGSLHLDGSATLADEGRGQRVFIFNSENLLFAECGIKEGSLFISNGTEKLKVTFKECRHQAAQIAN